MSIQVKCDACGREIRAADHLAGKVVRCPDCRQMVKVPGAALALDDDGPDDFDSVEQSPENPQATALPRSPGPWRDSEPPATPLGGARVPSSSAPVVYSPSDPAIWLVKTPDENVLGPIPRSQLDNWAEEGRLDPNCRIWAEGGQQSYLAGQLYPFLVPSAPQLPGGATPAAMLNADAYIPRDTSGHEIREELRRRKRQRRALRRISYLLGLVPIWMYCTAAILTTMLVSLVGMFISPQVAAVFTLGWYLIGIMLTGYSLLMILYAAGSEDWFCLMLMFICPGYVWYYMVTRWDDLWHVILLQLLGLAFLLFGTMLLGYWHQSLWFDF